MRKNIGKAIAFLTVVAFVVSGTLAINHASRCPRTDDAFLLADVAHFAPEVSGRIITLNIRSNQAVKKRDVLFVIDPEPYKLKLAAAEAQMDLATTTLARSEPLLSKGFVTAEQIDQMRATKASAVAAHALAARELAHTVSRAPFDGRILGLTVRDGEFAAAGQALFTLVDTSRWYAVANFRETELVRMKAGTPARVYVMGQPDTPLEGHVDSLGWGVLPDEAKLVNGIPVIPKTLNWVHLAQRFPVRILLKNPPQDMMRIGASAVAILHYGTDQ